MYRLKKDANRQYYWILQSSENHKIVAMSSESYDSKRGALNSISWTKANADKAGFEDNTQL